VLDNFHFLKKKKDKSYGLYELNLGQKLIDQSQKLKEMMIDNIEIPRDLVIQYP
jgi:hypothetical protein